MKGAARLLFTFMLMLGFLHSADTAKAQTRIQTQVSAQAVEVGQTFRVQIKAQGSEQPSSPRLEVPDGFVVNGPSIGTSHQMSIVNGTIERTVGLTATWQVTATKLGEFTLGPPSVTAPEGQIAGEKISIKVVAQGQAPPPARSRRRSPFDDDDDLFPGFGRPGRSLFDDLFQGRGLGSQPETPPEYQLDTAPDEVAFLRAEVDKKRVIIGEQVTLSIYAYGGRGRFNENNPTEPRRQNFFSIPLLERSGREPAYLTQIEGQQFIATKLREIALFPLATGRQEIGPMTIKFYGSNYVTRLSPEGLERSSTPLSIEVVEPPAAGRPTGYRLGDVGNYELSAEVQPRTVEAGGAVSVVATLKGVGHVPSQLITPDQHGVEWLNPTVTDQLRPLGDGSIGGSRTFNYVVRLTKPGSVNLGEVSLPFYNPRTQRYGVARATLGQVVVTESAAAASANQPKEPEKLSALAQVRPTQTAFTPRSENMADQLWYWLLLLGAPLGVFLVQLSEKLLTRVNQRRRGAADSLEKKAKDALAAAQLAKKTGDTKALLTNIERALFLSIEAHSGLKARAVLKEQLAKELVRSGVAQSQADELCHLLNETDSIRFGGAPVTDSQLLKRAIKLLKQMPGCVERTAA